MIKDVVESIQALDLWLIDQGVFVTPLAVSVVLLFGLLYWPQFWSYIRRYDKFKREFEKTFGLIEQQQSRQDFSWFLEREYRASNLHGSDADAATSLKYRLRNLEFPKEYPPKPDESIAMFAREKMSFTKPEDGVLWDFFKDTFKKMLDIYDAENEPPSTLREFFNSRRITSKFWDDVAGNIIEGRLRPQDIRRQLDASHTLMIALALAEFAMAHELTWDEGRGKTSLFIASLGLDDLDNQKWREYLRETNGAR